MARRINEQVVDILGERFQNPTTNMFIIGEHTFGGGAAIVDLPELQRMIAGDGAGQQSAQATSQAAVSA